jgi:hypothetical protein
MTPVDQDRFTPVDLSDNGNCLSACLASIMDLPLSEVPHFAGMGDKWFEPFMQFLSKHQYTFRGMYFFTSSNPEVRKPGTWEQLTAACPGVDGYFVCGGTSHREHVANGHAVVYNSQGVMVHDPHPNRNGLKELQDAYMIVRNTGVPHDDDF